MTENNPTPPECSNCAKTSLDVRDGLCIDCLAEDRGQLKTSLRRFNGITEILRDISGYDPYRRDAFATALRLSRKALVQLGQRTGDIEDSDTKAADSVQALILEQAKERDQLKAENERLRTGRHIGRERANERSEVWKRAAEQYQHASKFSGSQDQIDEAYECAEDIFQEAVELEKEQGS